VTVGSEVELWECRTENQHLAVYHVPVAFQTLNLMFRITTPSERFSSKKSKRVVQVEIEPATMESQLPARALRRRGEGYREKETSLRYPRVGVNDPKGSID